MFVDLCPAVGQSGKGGAKSIRVECVAEQVELLDRNGPRCTVKKSPPIKDDVDQFVRGIWIRNRHRADVIHRIHYGVDSLSRIGSECKTPPNQLGYKGIKAGWPGPEYLDNMVTDTGGRIEPAHWSDDTCSSEDAKSNGPVSRALLIERPVG